MSSRNPFDELNVTWDRATCVARVSDQEVLTSALRHLQNVGYTIISDLSGRGRFTADLQEYVQCKKCSHLNPVRNSKVNGTPCGRCGTSLYLEQGSISFFVGGNKDILFDMDVVNNDQGSLTLQLYEPSDDELAFLRRESERNTLILHELSRRKFQVKLKTEEIDIRIRRVKINYNRVWWYAGHLYTEYGKEPLPVPSSLTIHFEP